MLHINTHSVIVCVTMTDTSDDDLKRALIERRDELLAQVEKIQAMLGIYDETVVVRGVSPVSEASHISVRAQIFKIYKDNPTRDISIAELIETLSKTNPNLRARSISAMTSSLAQEHKLVKRERGVYRLLRK